MKVGVVKTDIQWEEIQRTVQDRAMQRQQLLKNQYSATVSNSDSSLSNENDNDEQRQQRTVFTKNGKLSQTYVPKGTLFDKIA